MPATYKVMTLPLHSVSPELAPFGFAIRIVSILEFPPGAVTSSDIADTVAAHPVLTHNVDRPLKGLAVPFADWVAAGKPVTPTAGISVALFYAGQKPLSVLQSTLASYLSRPAEVVVAGVQHDTRFDDLRNPNFVDINRVHDDLWLLRTAVYARAAESFGIAAVSTQNATSIEQARWLNSYAQGAALEAVFGDASAVGAFAGDVAISSAVARLRDDVGKIEARLQTLGNARAFVAAVGLRSATAAGETPVAVSDPNVGIHAALNNALLSEDCGISTRWNGATQQPVFGDHVLFLEETSFPQTAFPLVLSSTAFRRAGHTHPLSFVDIEQPGQPARTTNTGLACLNDENGNPRYRATAINAETAVIQGTLLQHYNSLSNTTDPTVQHTGDFTAPLDERPPQLLKDEHRGVNEPESAGLTISAPTADLVTPEALRDAQRTTLWPCLFLEDLWIGFRLDIADQPGGKFASVHQQVLQVTFTNAPHTISGPTEDFFAREQPAQAPAPTSTELFRYIGMSGPQARDYLRFLGTEKPVSAPVDAPFQAVVVSYSNVTPLLFGRVYRYRLRNVLLGGVSLSPEGADTLVSSEAYEQSCPFFRARAYRAGEVVSPDFVEPEGAPRSIILTQESPNARVWLVPAPIDMDTARYHGVFLNKTDEPQRHANRAFIQDIAKHFGSDVSNFRYFYDPDVSGVAVRITVLNGNPDSTVRTFVFEHGAYCELAAHHHLKPVEVKYGQEGEWEKFKPIELRFGITSSPRVQVMQNGRTVSIRLPASADLEITLLPQLTDEQLRRTASYAASSAQMQLRKLPGFSAASLILPTIAEQTLRVVHGARAPVSAPLHAGAAPRFSPAGEPIIVAKRAHAKETADLPGYIQVDAASAGQLRLEAAWSDVDDNPQHDRPMFTAATAVSQPRSIVFDRHQPEPGALVARKAMANAKLFAAAAFNAEGMFAHQCAENKVFLEALPEEQHAENSKKACTLDFGDARRKRATVTAIATSRYKSRYSKGTPQSFETRSDTMLVDVPASMRLPAPEISHVVPLSRDNEQAGEGTNRTQRFYAMRIYVRRPWFVSGPGERLAIGCRAGEASQTPQMSVDTFITQWGEDPLERPHLDVTRNAPRASNFHGMEHGNAAPLEEAYYPARSLEGASEVLYRDNLTIVDTASVKRTISVASFALRRDPSSRLWFCDVAVAGGFLGWCGLALYRHQPHAHEELQLSAKPAWIYSAVLHGEQIVWARRGDKLHVTVGPVFDRNLSFELDPRTYSGGISRELNTAAGARVPLQHYASDGQTFFEALVPVDVGPWSLIKRRFGSEVASIGLRMEV